MTSASRAANVLLLAVSIQLLLAGEAQAYLEPGSMNFMLQMIFGSVVAGVITLRIYWKKVVAGLRNRFLQSGSPGKEEEGA